MKKDSILLVVYYILSAITGILSFGFNTVYFHIPGNVNEALVIILGIITLLLGLFFYIYSYKAILLKLFPLIVIMILMYSSVYISQTCNVKGTCDSHAFFLIGLVPITIIYAAVLLIITWVARGKRALQNKVK